MQSVLLFCFFVLLALLIDHSIECCSRGRLDASDFVARTSIRGLKEPLSLFFVSSSFHLVHLLLLVEADLAGTHVDEEEQTADDGEDLEEVVLGEVLVGVVLVEL